MEKIGLVLTDAGEDRDVPCFLPSHVRQRCFYDVEWSEVVALKLVSDEI